jgi:long-chain acyl-CoA synthetase
MLIDSLAHQDRTRPKAFAYADPVSKLNYRNLTSLTTVMRDVVTRETQREKVGLMLPAGCAFVAAFFGTLWSDKVAVPLNFLLSPEELSDIVQDANIDVIVSIHPFDKLTEKLPVRIIHMDDLPLKRKVLWASLNKRPPVPNVDPDAMAVLLYTSGTSGAPKGVELTHRNLKSNCDAIIEAVGFDDSDRFLCVLPPFHVFGLTANILVPIIRGLSVFAIPRFSPAAVLRAIASWNPTVFLAVPSMYNALLRQKSAGKDAFRGFKILVSGGEPLPEKIENEFATRFGVPLLEGYGLTETSPVVSLSVPGAYKQGAVGRPVASVGVRVIDEAGSDVLDGDDGEIVVSGPSVMRGYHNQPAETARVINREGWFSTGDIGHIDSDGFLFITGRRKEMMIVGGENVFPREIETVISQHPAVEETAVIGATDPSRGEVPIAFVTVAEGKQVTESEVRAFARQRLAGYKSPRAVHIVDELPKGPTGKVSKKDLRATFDSLSKPEKDVPARNT